MTDEELRAMVRDAIVRHGSRESSTSSPRRELDPRTPGASTAHIEGRAAFALLPLPRGGDGDGLCLIEPTVRCTHCGYCLSYGH